MIKQLFWVAKVSIKKNKFVLIYRNGSSILRIVTQKHEVWMDALRAKKLTKSFPGVIALDSFDFTLRQGEIHSIVGENGAGKSTFVKLIAGIYKPTSGTYEVDGVRGMFPTPKDALTYIGLVHQDREIIPSFNGYENLFLGLEKTKAGILNRKEMKDECIGLIESYGLSVDLGKKAKDMGAGEQEMLTILKVLSRKPRILILDEPTAPLSTKESEALFTLVRSLKEKGLSIIYISHRLPEILSLSDRITVLKNGKEVLTSENNGLDERTLISAMVGKDIGNQYPRAEKEIGDEIFSVNNYSFPEENIKGISFNVKKGEIVGFAGLVGSGRTELNEAFFLGKGDGDVRLEGRKIHSKGARDSIKDGIVMVPEDRRGKGVILSMDIADNTSLPSMDELAKLYFIDRKKEKELVGSVMGNMAVSASSERQPVATLSGGNQQKVAIGKWLSSGAKLWIFDEPTQGIDVETKSAIYKMLGEFAKNGAGVIFISSDLRELVEISDRIYVMNNRKIVAEFPYPFNTDEILGKMVGDEE